MKNAEAFRVRASYISSAGNNLGEKEIVVTQDDVDKFRKDPSLLMGKGEYNKHIKEQQKEALSQKQHEYYERVNSIIDYANANRDILVVKENQKQLDGLISQLFDRTGFYSRLGFATIDESVLTVEYKFSYTSNGGMAQRSFTVPMTEETIAELIKVLESKLTASAFAKEQRTLMTRKLREFIKNRDNFTCCTCGNSTHVEPNLLLEIDHIIPVAKGGRTVEDNLQTLCWKCNRAKSDKIVA